MAISVPARSSVPASRTRRIPDSVRPILRLEGAAALMAGLVLYDRADGSWLLLLPLLLLPDLSLLGYAFGSRVGSVAYNLVHNWALGLAALGFGVWASSGLGVLAGAILIAHVGMDRLAGYGLKHPEGFKDTHMQRA